MAKATFEHEGNSGLLLITTHFGREVEIVCEKRDDEIFRLGGTAINDIAVYEGLVLSLKDDCHFSPFKAFRSEEVSFEDTGLLSDEDWGIADLHCYVTEYYDLDMEGRAPGWFISKKPIRDANHLFVNLDILDGGGNILRRYRVSPFTGEGKWLT